MWDFIELTTVVDGEEVRYLICMDTLRRNDCDYTEAIFDSIEAPYNW